MTKPTRPNAAPALPLLKPVENLTLRDQVTQAVRNALMHGHLQPGQPVTVKSIATMVGASVMPAREAMNRLIAEGALELRPNRTVIVPAMSKQEFDELTDLRCHIEAQAAAHAVEWVTREDIQTLKALDKAMHAAVPGADVETYLSRNFEFHFHIYQLGTSKFFLSIIEKLWVRVGPLIRFSLDTSGFGQSTKLHARVIRGLETKDSTLLRDAIQADINGAAQSIRKVRDASKAWF
jgi:DNA-binding GntR family transcriptional regulator